MINSINQIFKNKILLITGGTGSFGMAALEIFSSSKAKEIRIFSRDEKKQEDLRKLYGEEKIKFYIGDVRDYRSLHNAAKNVDYVFHAAALKQVPSCEFYPIEAVKTNIIGTENIIRVSNEVGVKKLVVLSTDKAVYPINVMGLTKAIAEKIVSANARFQTKGSTIVCCTRYGNVMASRGSVIPLFVNQLKSGKSLTITDPKMTRFLMSLKDSVKLVLYAFNHGKQGDIFVQKAPAATMHDLSRALSEIFNKKLKTKIIGTRHGEKLFETLVSREEMVKASDLGNFFCIPNDSRDLNYDKYFISGDSNITLSRDYTSHNTKLLNIHEIKKILLKLDFIKRELNA